MKTRIARAPRRTRTNGHVDLKALALHTSELRYRRLFESAQDGILILDGETGEIIDANPFLLDLLNYHFQEVIGLKLWEIGQFKDIAASKEAFKKLQETSIFVTITFPWSRRAEKISRSSSSVTFTWSTAGISSNATFAMSVSARKCRKPHGRTSVPWRSRTRQKTNSSPLFRMNCEPA